MELGFRFPIVIAGFRIPRAISGFQSPGFWIRQAKSFRNLDYLKFKWEETFIILRSGGRSIEKFLKRRGSRKIIARFREISGDFASRRLEL